MVEFILSKKFIEIYNSHIKEDLFNSSKLYITDKDRLLELEQTLNDFLIKVVGYRLNFGSQNEDFEEIINYFENIVKNKDKYKSTIIDTIKNYCNDYINLLEDHPLTKSFISSINNLYSPLYDGKKINNTQSNITNITVSHRDNSLKIFRFPKYNEMKLPTIIINNIDSFEKTLQNYLLCIKNSDSYYNILTEQKLDGLDDNQKIRIIFECTLYNATPSDLLDVERLFKNYTSFLTDDTFNDIRNLSKIGSLFDDEFYVMSKRAEIDYETPYYLAFMLRNKKVEFPNIRLGIDTQGNKKVAHILTIQTPQTILDINNYNMIQQHIKENMASDPYFRYYNPSHLISLLLTFGLLKGLGIDEIEVKNFFPIRIKKTIVDKKMNEEEAENFENRLVNKSIFTYMRLINMIDGLEIVSYPEQITTLKLKINDNLKFKNEFLENIYNVTYKFGNELKNKKTIENKKY